VKIRGYTLIEVLIVIVIVAILVTIAYPFYANFVNSARRVDAMAAIAGLGLAQEQLRASCPFYGQNLGNANVCGADAANTTVNYDALSSEGFYILSIVANSATGNGYTVSADPQNAQAGDSECDPMIVTIDAANPRGMRGPDGCWD